MTDSAVIARKRNYYVKDFLLYLTVQKNLSPRTIKAYEHDLKKFFDFLSPYLEQELTLQDIDDRTVMEFLSHLKLDKSYSAKSLNRKISSLSTYFSFLEKEKFIEHSPLNKIDTVKLPVRLPKALESNELDRLIHAIDSQEENSENAIFLKKRDKAIVELFYATGMRISELAGLTLSKINLLEGFARVIGKGNKERIVFINKNAVKSVQDYLNIRPVIEKDNLFVSQKGGELTVRAIQHLFAKYIKKSGLPWSSPHAIRHTFATHMLDGGADLVTIKELLGHANLSTTQIYLSVSQKRMKQVYETAHPEARKGDISKEDEE